MNEDRVECGKTSVDNAHTMVSGDDGPKEYGGGGEDNAQDLLRRKRWQDTYINSGDGRVASSNDMVFSPALGINYIVFSEQKHSYIRNWYIRVDRNVSPVSACAREEQCICL
jgi:hypothetical protein